ncbi:MAG: DUF1743 domain-containing protein [Candidatus Thermoplasmatota archaeon]
MRVGLDDTDSLTGGCTTHALFALLAAVPELALAAPPSLVRLNPNAPRKTRGNGAIAFDLVQPRGAPRVVGAWKGTALFAYPDGAPVAASKELLARLWTAVEQVAEPEAGAGLTLANEPPSASFYWEAVRGLVATPEATGGLHAKRGDGWGLVGARAAAAWPGPPSSFELIAYREPNRVGTKRTVVAAPLAALDGAVTFHSFDAEADRLTCVPNTPCPVLAGLRGRDADALLDAGLAALRLAAEPFDTWMLWQSNQGSGDHVVRRDAIDAADAGLTVAVAALVTAAPRREAGGHLVVPCMDAESARFDAVAFEPTKRFRDTVEALRPGDAVAVVGALVGTTVQLEKVQVRSLAPDRVRVERLPCPACGKALKSVGVGAGLRCAACGTKAPESERWRNEPRRIALGWHEVPVAARRHLHRPLAWDVTAT